MFICRIFSCRFFFSSQPSSSYSEKCDPCPLNVASTFTAANTGSSSFLACCPWLQLFCSSASSPMFDPVFLRCPTNLTLLGFIQICVSCISLPKNKKTIYARRYWFVSWFRNLLIICLCDLASVSGRHFHQLPPRCLSGTEVLSVCRYPPHPS